MFGNSRSYQAPGSDDAAATQQQTYIDGVMPPAQAPAPPAQAQAYGDDQAMQQSVDDLMSQTAPPLTDQPVDYLAVDPSPAPISAPAALPEPAPESQPAPAPQEPMSIPVGTDLDELNILKQQALRELTPIVGQLEQTPEEKFHTTMMMLQATDDQTLVKVAYEAAHAITDEKMRAQALLDVVNEINYFTNNANKE